MRDSEYSTTKHNATEQQHMLKMTIRSRYTVTVKESKKEGKREEKEIIAPKDIARQNGEMSHPQGDDKHFLDESCRFDITSPSITIFCVAP